MTLSVSKQTWYIEATTDASKSPTADLYIVKPSTPASELISGSIHVTGPEHILDTILKLVASTKYIQRVYSYRSVVDTPTDCTHVYKEVVTSTSSSSSSPETKKFIPKEDWLLIEGPNDMYRFVTSSLVSDTWIKEHQEWRVVRDVPCAIEWIGWWNSCMYSWFGVTAALCYTWSEPDKTNKKRTRSSITETILPSFGPLQSISFESSNLSSADCKYLAFLAGYLQLHSSKIGPYWLTKPKLDLSGQGYISKYQVEYGKEADAELIRRKRCYRCGEFEMEPHTVYCSLCRQLIQQEFSLQS